MDDSCMCVPGPGKYFSALPRSCPGRAMEGRAIEVACLKVAMVGVDEYFFCSTLSVMSGLRLCVAALRNYQGRLVV